MLKLAYNRGVQAAIEKVAKKEERPGLAARLGMGSIPIAGPIISQLAQDPSDPTRGLGAGLGQAAGALGAAALFNKNIGRIEEMAAARPRLMNHLVKGHHQVSVPVGGAVLGGLLGEGAQSGVEGLMG